MELKTKIPEGYEVDKEKSTFENIVFKPLTKSKYPLSIYENKLLQQYTLHTKLSNRNRAEAFLALSQLVELRDVCNEIDGCIDFVIGSKNYAIIIYDNEISKLWSDIAGSVLHFRKKSTRDLFLEIHKELINTAKELL